MIVRLPATRKQASPRGFDPTVRCCGFLPIHSTLGKKLGARAPDAMPPIAAASAGTTAIIGVFIRTSLRASVRDGNKRQRQHCTRERVSQSALRLAPLRLYGAWKRKDCCRMTAPAWRRVRQMRGRHVESIVQRPEPVWMALTLWWRRCSLSFRRSGRRQPTNGGKGASRRGPMRLATISVWG